MQIDGACSGSRLGSACRRILIAGVSVLLLAAGTGYRHAAQAQGAVVVNNVALSAETLAALRSIYPVAIQPGRYWYDPFSGVYGAEGGPVAGQMLPGLGLGGPLRADASRGTSGVFINGRQLQAGEKAYLEVACNTPIMPARYWVNSTGIGGFEGQPPAFNLALCGGARGRSSGGSSTRTWCDANGACTSSGILGYITTVR